MILSDKDIKIKIIEREIVIDPPLDFESALSSCSVDYKLHNEFCTFSKNGETEKVTVKPGESFILNPGDFVLGSTIENLSLPDNIAGRLEGRSSIARLGVIVHSTASLFDPGWRGQMTLELTNLGPRPVSLTPGMRICSMSFELLSSVAEVPYYKKKNAKYVNQVGPTISMLEKIVVKKTN